MADTLTQEDVAAAAAKAVADAIAPLEAQLAERDTKIAELNDAVGQRDEAEATTKAVADAVEPLNTKIAELQSALDAEVLARGEADTERQALVDWLDDAASQVSVEQRRGSRVAAVKDTGAYPEDSFDETVATNKDRIDRWAEMDDVAFDSLIDGLNARRPSKAEGGNGPLPGGRSAMTDTVTAGAAAPAKSSMKTLLESTIPSLASTQASN